MGSHLQFFAQGFKSLPWASRMNVNGSYILQYLVEAGVAHAIRQVRGLTVTFGPRWEGVPAKDLIGGSLGFRRPGYAVSLAPGFQ